MTMISISGAGHLCLTHQPTSPGGHTPKTGWGGNLLCYVCGSVGGNCSNQSSFESRNCPWDPAQKYIEGYCLQTYYSCSPWYKNSRPLKYSRAPFNYKYPSQRLIQERRRHAFHSSYFVPFLGRLWYWLTGCCTVEIISIPSVSANLYSCLIRLCFSWALLRWVLTWDVSLGTSLISRASNPPFFMRSSSWGSDKAGINVYINPYYIHKSIRNKFRIYEADF